MINFELLEALYESISSAEKGLADFDGYAVYELDGGISVWIKTEKAVLDNIEKQKQLLRHIRDKSSCLTDEQRAVMQVWNLGE